MLPRTSFVFDRQRIVVAGDESAVIAFVIETLRHDGHCVTHAGDTEFTRSDFGVRDCHLLITGSSLSGMRRTDLIDELRGLLPAVAVLCLAGAKRTTPERLARSCSGVPILREPFTAEELRAAVRPLLPHLSRGSVLARRADPAPLTAEA